METAHWWPGVFTTGRLHRVQQGNTARLALNDRRFGLGDCGAACLPAPTDSYEDLPRCALCLYPRIEAHEPGQHQELSERPTRPVSVPLDIALGHGVGPTWHDHWTSDHGGDDPDTE